MKVISNKNRIPSRIKVITKMMRLKSRRIFIVIFWWTLNRTNWVAVIWTGMMEWVLLTKRNCNSNISYNSNNSKWVMKFFALHLTNSNYSNNNNNSSTLQQLKITHLFIPILAMITRVYTLSILQKCLQKYLIPLRMLSHSINNPQLVSLFYLNKQIQTRKTL